MTLTTRWLAIAGVALLLAGAARAEDPAPDTRPDPTAEQRKQMAESHRQMAECLASETPFADCRAQMHARCVAIMGQGNCGMGMGMGRGPGKGRGPTGGMMPAPPAEKQ